MPYAHLYWLLLRQHYVGMCHAGCTLAFFGRSYNSIRRIPELNTMWTAHAFSHCIALAFGQFEFSNLIDTAESVLLSLVKKYGIMQLAWIQMQEWRFVFRRLVETYGALRRWHTRKSVVTVHHNKLKCQEQHLHLLLMK